MNKLLMITFLTLLVSCELKDDCEACQKCIDEINLLNRKTIEKIRDSLDSLNSYESKHVRMFSREDYNKTVDELAVFYNLEFSYLRGRYTATKQVLKIISRNHPTQP